MMRKLISLGAILASGLTSTLACGGAQDDGLFQGGSGGSEQDAASGGTAGSGNSAGSAGSGAEAGAGNTSGGGGSGGAAGSSGGAGGSAGSTGGAAGAGGGTGGGGTTLDNVCDTLPTALCKERVGCCTQAHGYEEKSCIANEKADCDKAVEEVKKGLRDFHPESIDHCLTALKPLLATCIYTGAQLGQLLTTINACNRIFDAKAQPGSACNATSDCQSSGAANGYVSCNDSKHCVQGTLGGAGDACGDNALCQDGLWCEPGPTTPKCSPTTPQGSGCSTSLQCGYGYLCAGFGTSATCQVAGGGGANCTYYHHCQSLRCQQGKCTTPEPYVTAKDCGK